MIVEKEKDVFIESKKPKEEVDDNRLSKLSSHAYDNASEAQENLLKNLILKVDEEKTESNAFMELVLRENGVIKREQVSQFLEVLAEKKGHESFCALVFIYKYYKYTNDEEPFFYVDGEIELLSNFLPERAAAKTISILLKKAPELVTNLFSAKGGIDAFSTYLRNCFLDEESAAAASQLICAIFDTGVYDTELHGLFKEILMNIEGKKNQKWGFRALEIYIKKKNHIYRTNEIINATDVNIFSSITIDEKSFVSATSLIKTIFTFHAPSVDLFSRFLINTIFKLLVTRYNPDMPKKIRKGTLKSISKIVVLFEESIEGEDELDFVNWYINAGVYDVMMENYKRFPSSLCEYFIMLLAKMVSRSTMSMFAYMNRFPVISMLAETLAYSCNEEEDAVSENISNALYRIAAFLSIQNDVSGFEDVFAEANIDVTQEVISKSKQPVIYDPENESIELDDSLRDDIVSFIEADDGTHECLRLFLEKIDSIFGVEENGGD